MFLTTNKWPTSPNKTLARPSGNSRALYMEFIARGPRRLSEMGRLKQSKSRRIKQMKSARMGNMTKGIMILLLVVVISFLDIPRAMAGDYMGEFC